MKHFRQALRDSKPTELGYEGLTKPHRRAGGFRILLLRGKPETAPEMSYLHVANGEIFGSTTPAVNSYFCNAHPTQARSALVRPKITTMPLWSRAEFSSNLHYYTVTGTGGTC